MRQRVNEREADRQLPIGDEVFLDHVGHFVRDKDAAAAALSRAGFAPTPVSIQANPDGTPTGTGNITAMLARGYIEVLFKTADTPLGLEFDASLARHTGLHLAAFAVGDAAAQHARLTAEGFPMRPLVQFQRPVETEGGPGVAAFTVVRVDRGAMAEGRIQMLTHRTEDTVWQTRWLDHPNGVLGLLDLVIACADVDEAAGRFTRLTGREAVASAHGQSISLDRGRVQLVTQQAFTALLSGIPVPTLPFMGCYALQVRSLDVVERMINAAGLSTRCAGGALIVPFPDELGAGAWVMVEDAMNLPWR